MTRAGVFRALTPQQYGGLEMDPASFFEGIMKIAGAESSAGWIGGQLNVHSFEIALMDKRLQDEFWQDGPDTRASSSYAPTGEWTAVDGGYIVNGTWGFSSGVDHGWHGLAVHLDGVSGVQLPAAALFDFAVDLHQAVFDQFLGLDAVFGKAGKFQCLAKADHVVTDGQVLGIG